MTPPRAVPNGPRCGRNQRPNVFDVGFTAETNAPASICGLNRLPYATVLAVGAAAGAVAGWALYQWRRA